MRKSKFGRASTKGIKSETASSNSSHFILYDGRSAKRASTPAMTAYDPKQTSPTCQSITSSATARREPGILIPSALAVLRLKLSSNLRA
jgi:hypothetical protein